jgi:hypothetical protein
MEAISQAVARIDAIQSRVLAGVAGFPAILDATTLTPEGLLGLGASGLGGSPISFGTMLGPSGFLPVAAAAGVDGVISAAGLERYLAAIDGPGRNGHLGDDDLVAVSGAWDQRPARLLPPAATGWEAMRRAAAADGIDLRSIDTYRSWEAQAVGHQAYLDGKKAAYVAPPGHSEHGVGLAVDVTNGGLVGPGDGEWEWLRANASRFGWFPISNESWHWEFRGV